jgi:DNA primase
MERITRDQIEAIKKANPIESIITAYVNDLRYYGERLVGRCPFHDDREPSFNVWPETQSFYCFGCGVGGDLFTFLEKMKGVTFPQACELLQTGAVERRDSAVRRGRVPYPWVGRGSSAQLDEEDKEILDAATVLYHAQLMRSQTHQRLLGRRGISVKMIKRFKVGWCNGKGLRGHLQTKRLSLLRAQRIGLLGQKGEHFRERFVVPEIRKGHTIYLIGRAARPGLKPKYLALPLPKPLYGVEDVKRRDEVFVVEGVFDWMTLTSWGYPTIALLGTMLGREGRSYLEQFRTVYLLLDSDEEGRSAGREIQSQLARRAKVVDLSNGVKDPNQLAYLERGKEVLAQAVAEARTPH